MNIDRRGKLPPVEHQGTSSKCVGSACAALAYELGHSVPSEQIYEQAKLLDRLPGVDYLGTEIEAGVRVLENMGFGKVRAVAPQEVTQTLQKSCVVFHYPTKLLSGYNGDPGLYHAMTVVGYASGAFIVRNSWGADWGNEGYFTIPEQEFYKHASSICYTLVSAQQVKKEDRKNILPFIIAAGVLAAGVLAYVILS